MEISDLRTVRLQPFAYYGAELYLGTCTLFGAHCICTISVARGQQTCSTLSIVTTIIVAVMSVMITVIIVHYAVIIMLHILRPH